MTEILILALTDGVAICQEGAQGWSALRVGLAGVKTTSVIARESVILAGSLDGVYRSDDQGVTWDQASAGLRHPHVRWLAYHPEVSDLEFAGTEPAGIFVSHDGAKSWRASPQVEALRDQFGWYLPYSPEAGCVRGFAFHGERLYAAVEVGGVLTSSDRGETWALVLGSPGDPHHSPPKTVHPDVHSILVHPMSPELVFAPTGDGFFRSTDGGKTWEKLYDCYCRAVWVNPDEPNHIILGPADGVDRNGRIEVSADGGTTWRPASSGLDVPWPRGMVERFYQQRKQLFALLSNGKLYSASLSELVWREAVADIGRIQALAFLEEV